MTQTATTTPRAAAQTASVGLIAGTLGAIGLLDGGGGGTWANAVPETIRPARRKCGLDNIGKSLAIGTALGLLLLLALLLWLFLFSLPWLFLPGFFFLLWPLFSLLWLLLLTLLRLTSSLSETSCQTS